MNDALMSQTGVNRSSPVIHCLTYLIFSQMQKRTSLIILNNG